MKNPSAKLLNQQKDLLKEQRKQNDLMRTQNKLMTQANKFMQSQTQALGGKAEDNGKPTLLGSFGKLAGAAAGALGETLHELHNDLRTSGGIVSDHVRSEIARGQTGGDPVMGSGTTMGEVDYLPPPGPANPLLRESAWPYLIMGGNPRVQLDSFFLAPNESVLNTYLADRAQETTYPYTATLLAHPLSQDSDLAPFTRTLATNPQIYGTTAYGPRHIMEDLDTLDATLTNLLNTQPKLIALGPVGLDRDYAPHTLPQQQAQLALQLEIAADFNLPVFLTNRNAMLELATLLHTLPTKPALIYTEVVRTRAEKEFVMEHDMSLLIRPEITWPEEKDYHQFILNIPRHKWLMGSGNGLLSTHNHKGSTATPRALAEVLSALASLCAQPEEALLSQLNANAYRLFHKE